MTNIQLQAINAIRMLSIEAIEKANSGHPGLPLGTAVLAYKLWADHLVHNPKNPNFMNRDRFVLSAGHGSMLVYSLLHLFGYGLPLTEIKNFRQYGSKTPGHPEFGHTVGIETTTGPLGQGYANAVGMAIAETVLAANFNKEGYPIVDHYTYAIAGDGCMMEGISNEAASLAGTLQLSKLIVFYDDNEISIEGDTDIAFREDVGLRHKALGWNVIYVKDGNDIREIGKAIQKAKLETQKPTLIVCKTTIGYGSPLQGEEACHGAPLGRSNIEATKAYFGWEHAPFEVPKTVYNHYKKLAKKGEEAEQKWNDLFASYQKAYPELAVEFTKWMKNELPNLRDYKDLFKFDKPDATRNTGGTVLNKLADIIPNLIGGSADLAPSNKSNMKKRSDYSAINRLGTNMHFGVREHAMGAITNGMYLHGGLNVYCATFFIFSDYMKNAIRLSAIMDIPVTYILTHDSIGVGEDGPTHQPIEQLTGLRSVPNLKVWRPADGVETAAAYIDAFKGHGPTCIALTRQNLPQYSHNSEDYFKGGYILSDSEKIVPDAILIATGSEVEIAMNAKKDLKDSQIDVRVVSMPCLEIFDKQSDEYKETVLPKQVKNRISIEAGSTMGWYKYVGLDGLTIGIDSFGLSAPSSKIFEHFGLTARAVALKVEDLIKKNQ